MQIIKQGVDPKTYPIEFVCYTCHTEFLCNQDECGFTSDQRDGSYWTYDCPTCKRTCTSSKYGKAPLRGISA